MKTRPPDLDYGEYADNGEKVGEYCREIIQVFTDFVIQLLEDYDKENSRQVKLGLKPLDLALFGQIYLDANRLQYAVMSAFIDIKRCVDFHNLFDCSHKVDICEHKVSGCLTRWFMRFCPAIIPSPLVADAESFYLARKGALGPADEATHRAWELLDLVTRLNEHFILHFVLHVIIAIPRYETVFFRQVEKRDLIYHLTYRAGHLQGTDWSMIFHWIQQGLSPRPALAYALWQGLKKVDFNDKPDLRAIYEDLTKQMDEAHQLLPDPD
jgi:hypothetical protein